MQLNFWKTFPLSIQQLKQYRISQFLSLLVRHKEAMGMRFRRTSNNIEIFAKEHLYYLLNLLKWEERDRCFCKICESHFENFLGY